MVTVNDCPSHLPVANPPHVCSAKSGGCGRPSSQTGVSTDRSHSKWKALICLVTPSGREHVEVWAQEGNEAPHRIAATVVSTPTELTQAFAIEGSGEMRLFLVGSREAADPAAVIEAIRGRGHAGLRVGTFAVSVP